MGRLVARAPQTRGRYSDSGPTFNTQEQPETMSNKRPSADFISEVTQLCSPATDEARAQSIQSSPQLAGSAHCVWEEENGAKIYLTNITAAEFTNILDILALGIRAVVNCTPASSKHPDRLTYCQVPVRDIETANIARYFPTTCYFLRHQLLELKQSVLVHCMAGVSRSATIVLAYLMQCHGLSLATAFRHVRQRRPIIQPNAGFCSQLRGWEAQQQRGDGHVPNNHKTVLALNLAADNPDWPDESLVLFATLRNVFMDEHKEICFGSRSSEMLADASLLQALDFVWGRGVSDICLEWLVGLCDQRGGIAATGQKVIAIMEGAEFNEMFAGEVYPSWVEKVKQALQPRVANPSADCLSPMSNPQSTT